MGRARLSGWLIAPILAVAVALGWPLAAGHAASDAATAAPVVPAHVIRQLPHDAHAFTEGLFIDGGQMFESTGMEGRSFIRQVDLATGRVVAQTQLPANLFGEGIAPWGKQILSLTWRDGVGFRWSRASFAPLGRFVYMGEGWGMSAVPAGAVFAGLRVGPGGAVVMSDGSDTLKLVNPETFRVIATLRVDDGGRGIDQLNELEWVDGEVLANVWQTDRIARISPADGRVIGWIDVSALHGLAGVHGADQVANGIAWDKSHRRLYVTGKEWPLLFEIAAPKAGPKAGTR